MPLEVEGGLRQAFSTAAPARRRKSEPSSERLGASTRALAARYGLNPKTVAKWRKRTTVNDEPMGPRKPRTAALDEAQEARVVELRDRAMLALDDLLGSLREGLPRLGRSALHAASSGTASASRPKGETDSKRGRFSETELGYLHVDAAEMRTAEGKVHVFLAVDRVSKLLHAEVLDAVTMADGAAFMASAVEAFPYRVHTVLTDDGVCFADGPRYRNGLTASLRVHVFDRVCQEHGIKHRLTEPYHPWTDGQAERMVRTLKEAIVESFHYETRADLEAHLRAWVVAYNLGKHLKGVPLEDALPGDLRRLGQGPERLQGRSAPPHRGTEHLSAWRRADWP